MLEDIPSLLEIEHSRVYRTPSTQFGETFPLVQSVRGILIRKFLTVSNLISIISPLIEKFVDHNLVSFVQFIAPM